MSDKELIIFLSKNRGYLKKGALVLAKKFNVEPSRVRRALHIVKNNLQQIATSQRVEAREERVQPSYTTFPNNRDLPGTYWVTGCAHAPWHNKKMYDSTFNFIEKEVDLTGLILAGDIIDLNSLSSHDRGKLPIKGVTLDWEYSEGSKFLDQIDQVARECKTKDFLYGNHEDRYLRSMKDVDTAKYGTALKSPEEGLNLIHRGYNIYNNWKDHSIQLGHYLDICHGEFLNIHSAKKTIDTYRKSTMYFHTHRYQVYMEGLVAGWNMGAGADFSAPVFNYATRAMKNSWVNSSCLVTLDSQGFYHVQPLIFMKNKLIVNGREY